MKNKKSLLKKGLPIILLGGAALALYYYFRRSAPAADTNVAPNLPPGSSPAAGPPTSTPAPVIPAAPQPVMIGKKAITNKFTPIGYSPYLTSVARYGGSDGKGGLEKGRTAGVILSVDNAAKTAQVQNYTYPAKDYTGKMYYTYYVRIADLNGDY